MVKRTYIERQMGLREKQGSLGSSIEKKLSGLFSSDALETAIRINQILNKEGTGGNISIMCRKKYPLFLTSNIDPIYKNILSWKGSLDIFSTNLDKSVEQIKKWRERDKSEDYFDNIGEINFYQLKEEPKNIISTINFYHLKKKPKNAHYAYAVKGKNVINNKDPFTNEGKYRIFNRRFITKKYKDFFEELKNSEYVKEHNFIK